MSRSVALLLVACSMAGAARADGDPETGKAIFAQCLACHTIEPGAADQTGPNLRGVLGKPAATNRATFKYSAALAGAGLTWDDDTLDRWIRNPALLVPGTKMEFVGLSSKKKRDDVLAYLHEALK